MAPMGLTWYAIPKTTEMDLGVLWALARNVEGRSLMAGQRALSS